MMLDSTSSSATMNRRRAAAGTPRDATNASNAFVAPRSPASVGGTASVSRALISCRPIATARRRLPEPSRAPDMSVL
jgi:hypothetical protein